MYGVTTYRVDISCEVVEIYQDVDTRVGKCRHAPVVVGRGVNVVDTDSIGAQCLHCLRVERALFGVLQRVMGDQLICNAWKRELAIGAGTRDRTSHTLNEELLPRRVKELVSHHGNLRERGCHSRRGSGNGSEARLDKHAGEHIESQTQQAGPKNECCTTIE